MQTPLPAIIAAYVEANNRFDADAVAACFAEDAAVRDEGRTLRGRQEIAQWKDAAFKKYAAQFAPTSVAVDGDKVVLSAEVSGTFPGSPLAMKFDIVLSGGLIGSLQISA